MLAFIPPLPSPPDHYSPSTILTPVSTMSLAILPSAAPTSCRAQATLPPLITSTAKASKRPKLSLNTSDATTMFGKKSTSLRLETLSATSPTALNTFSNGYATEPATMRQPLSSSPPPRLSLSTELSSTRPSTPEQTDDSPGGSSQHSASSSTRSTSSSLLGDSSPEEIPYKLSFSIPSILRNGPLPRPKSYKLFAKPMFPISKKVSFRAPLTEDIVTSKYTVTDFEVASTSSSVSTLSLPSPELSSLADCDDDASTVSLSSSPSPSPFSQRLMTSPSDRERAHIGDKREPDEEQDSDSCPQTPIAGRRKRVRDWRWTLGAVEGATSSRLDVQQDGA